MRFAVTAKNWSGGVASLPGSRNSADPPRTNCQYVVSRSLEIVVPIIEAAFADNFIVLVMLRQIPIDDDDLRIIYSIPRLT
jgi:hypothetical protein